MVELSKYEFEPLREDGALILYRGRSTEEQVEILVLSALDGLTLPDSLRRLENEYSLKEELDPSWAVQPISLATHWDRTVLILQDPGGIPLSHFLGLADGTSLFGETSASSMGSLSQTASDDKSCQVTLCGQALEVGMALRLAISISAAIGALHQRGIIHKDIKPANVLVSSISGQCRLTGFGIASRLTRERQAPTPPEFIAGTLPYMAPEQTGRMNRSIDSRSDLYALGVVLYEMLTGTLPFSASDPMEWVHCHIARQAASPSERMTSVPGIVSAVVMKLLAKTAEERYQTAAGVEFDLRKCLTQWESLGRIDPFPLGIRDISDLLLIPEKLYGRDEERRIVLEAFDRVALSGESEVVLVSGYSGVGKSSIVHELGKAVALRQGLFISGKFDQHEQDIPYMTLAQAFRGVIRLILSENEEKFSCWRDSIREAVGINGQLLVNLVPELELIIGKQSPVPDLPLEAAQNRFQILFLRFLRAFARADHPVALFLDDLQWLDVATLELLNRLATEPDVSHLLLVGAYRDNEVSPSHPLAWTLEHLRGSGTAVEEIVLEPLSVGDIEELVRDALHWETNRARPLADLVHEKTGGNPFFAIQFLITLAEDGLLGFDERTAAWTWDLSQVRARFYSDNVVGLMTDKLRRLPQSTQEVLKQLACLGNSVNISTLNRAYEQPEESVQTELRHAVRAGLVFNSGGTYTFLHDRIREAAYSLIPENERPAAHLKIGRMLASSLTAEEISEEIFEIVNHLKRAGPLVIAREERRRVAELNLIAAKRAKTSEAYVSALNYLAESQAFLAEDFWSRDHTLAFDVMLNRAECEVRTGLVTEAQERLSTLLQRAENRVEDSSVACLRVALFMMQGQFDRAVEVCLAYLHRAGIDWSPHPTKEEVEREYAKIWQQIGARSIEELVNLPLATDPDCRATQDVLAVLSTPAWFTDENLHELVGAYMANLSLEYGNCDGSCHGYARLGAILGSKLGQYQAGLRFGQLAIDLVEKRRLYRFEALVYAAFGHHILPWTRHLKAGRLWNQRAINAARESGNLAFAAFSSSNMIANLLVGGEPLEDVQHEAERGLEFAQKIGFGLVSDYIISALRLIRTLRGLTPTFGVFNDEEFEESRFEQHLEESPRSAMAACRYWIRKLQARFYVEDYAGAIAAAAKVESLQIRRSFLEVADYPLFSALAHAAIYSSAPADKQASHLETIATQHRQLAIWAENCSENFGSSAALVGAEIARIQGRPLDAMELYEDAIRFAHSNGFIQNEALAAELASRFYAARGFNLIAQSYLGKARASYLRWGAVGKVRQLDQTYPQLSVAETTPRLTSTIGAPVDHLDVATVIKVSQVLSGEIVLEKLIDTLMRMVIEQAGAQRGLLILTRDEDHRVEAEVATTTDTVVVRLKETPVTADTAPVSIVRYVARTRESVILDDALTRHPFYTDSYFRQHHTRSVLCLPLINQAKLIGLLYLENNLSPGVFTPTRIAALNLLASQAAISLENTRLYRDLEQREAKIRRLVDANIIGICIWNFDGEIVEANEAFLQIVQYSREDLASGRLRWTDLTPPEWAEQVERAHAEVMTIGAAKPYEKEYFRKDGSRVPVLAGSALFEKGGREGVAFVVDLSEQKRVEGERREAAEALQKAQAELAHVSRVTTLGELSASIAHEINQPLAALVADASACIRWIAAQNLDQARNCASRVIANGTRASGIIGRIRALAKKSPPQKDWLDLNDTIGEVLSIADSQIRRNQVSLQTQLSSELPLIMGDKIQLQQVILNLLVNAIEAMSGMSEESRQLWLTSERVTKPSPTGTTMSSSIPEDHVLVAVRDSGPGLDHVSLSRLFDAFYTTKSHGLGMGLAISRTIIEAHGGRLEAAANTPKGAVFQFRLPVERSTANGEQ